MTIDRHGWDDDPLEPRWEPGRFVVRHGGPGPDLGVQGCTCPGLVGDLDRYGCPGGATIDNLCPHHGLAARRRASEEARRSLQERWAMLDEAEAAAR